MKFLKISFAFFLGLSFITPRMNMASDQLPNDTVDDTMKDTMVKNDDKMAEDKGMNEKNNEMTKKDKK